MREFPLRQNLAVYRIFASNFVLMSAKGKNQNDAGFHFKLLYGISIVSFKGSFVALNLTWNVNFTQKSDKLPQKSTLEQI